LAAAVAVAALIAGPARADLVGHGGMVRALALSPDGTRVLTGSFDYTARLWDFVGQSAIATLDAHAGPVTSVAFVSDRAAVTAGDDGVAILWDLDPVAPRRRFVGHRAKIMDLAVSPDRRLLATGGWDRTVRLWRLADGAALATVALPTNVNALAFVAGGAALVAGGHDGMLRRIRVADGAVTDEAAGHDWGVTDLALSPDGRRLLSSSTDGTVRLWDAATLAPGRVLEGHDGPVFGVAFLADGRSAVSVGRDGMLIHWDLDSGAILRTIEAHAAPIWAVAVTNDGRFALTASSDERVRIWHLATGDRIGLDVAAAADEPKPWLRRDDPGARLYRKCARCHTLAADGPRRSGPTLAGLFGRRAGSVPGYHYSAALRGRRFVWNARTLRALFTEGPDVYLPGTKMPMQRVPDEHALAALIAFLREVTAPPAGGE